MARRGQIEIYRDILKTIGEGTDKPTRLMYRANMSWTSLQIHLTALIENGFVHVEVISKTPNRGRGRALLRGKSPTYTTKRYTLTEKGHRANKQLQGLCTDLDVRPMAII